MAVESVRVTTPSFAKTTQAEGPFQTISTAVATLKAVDVAEDQAVAIVGTIMAVTSDFSNVARYQFAATFRRVAAGDVSVPAFKFDEVGGYTGNRPRVRANANVGTQQGEILIDGRSGETINYFIETLVVETL